MASKKRGKLYGCSMIYMVEWPSEWWKVVESGGKWWKLDWLPSNSLRYWEYDQHWDIMGYRTNLIWFWFCLKMGCTPAKKIHAMLIGENDDKPADVGLRHVRTHPWDKHNGIHLELGFIPCISGTSGDGFERWVYHFIFIFWVVMMLIHTQMVPRCFLSGYGWIFNNP